MLQPLDRISPPPDNKSPHFDSRVRPDRAFPTTVLVSLLLPVRRPLAFIKNPRGTVAILSDMKPRICLHNVKLDNEILIDWGRDGSVSSDGETMYRHVIAAGLQMV
ncbi:hypothetical protein J6590_053793 [Homalodisca vitripennis]|nr:hypothetical protein J6590_053793 [Homalodisca vitripennis]